MEPTEEQLTEVREFAESLREDLSYIQGTLTSFISKAEKFEASVVEWNSFLDQAGIELKACQTNAKSFDDLEENVERLQVMYFLFYINGKEAG